MRSTFTPGFLKADLGLPSNFIQDDIYPDTWGMLNKWVDDFYAANFRTMLKIFREQERAA